MAENLIRAWWARLRGQLGAKPCPYRFAWVLDMPMRAWHAGPAKILGAFGLEPGEKVLEIGPGTDAEEPTSKRQWDPVSRTRGR